MSLETEFERHYLAVQRRERLIRRRLEVGTEIAHLQAVLAPLIKEETNLTIEIARDLSNGRYMPLAK